MVDLAPIEAVLAAGHDDRAHVGVSISLLRALVDDVRRGRAAQAQQRAASTIATICEGLGE